MLNAMSHALPGSVPDAFADARPGGVPEAVPGAAPEAFSPSPGAWESRLAGCLYGCAVGDAIGLPFEGLSPRRLRRFAPLPLRHRLVFGRGMVSDDTDHTVFAAQALILGRGDAEAFRAALAWRLRLWLLCLPAGVGLATLKGTLRLWLGLKKSGVPSAGNGPAMKSAVIGAALPGDAAARRRHVEAATFLTHTDPKALAAALAVAEIAARLASGDWRQAPSPLELAKVLAGLSADPAWGEAVVKIAAACAARDPLAAAAEAFAGRRGVSGYALHSVPFAIVAWHQGFGDFRGTLEDVVLAGGDVDTVGAIAGALAGLSAGPEAIPAEWLAGIADYPHGPAYLGRLAAELAGRDGGASTAFSPWLLPRGLVFLAVVLAHGFRRLLPPY